MRLLRMSSTEHNFNHLAIEGCFKKLQATRDAYRPLEEAYDDLEERLDREDYEVAELELRISKQDLWVPESRENDLDSQSSNSDAGFPDSRSISSNSDADDSDILDVTREQHHPLFSKYLSRLGDADLRREDHSELVIEHKYLLEAQEARQRFGIELLPEDQIKLASFPAEEAKLLDNLREIEADIERLRLECLLESLLDDGDVLSNRDAAIEQPLTLYSRLDGTSESDIILQNDTAPPRTQDEGAASEVTRKAVTHTLSGRDDDWLCKFVNLGMFSNDYSQDILQNDIFQDIRNQRLLVNQSQHGEHLGPSETQEIPEGIDPFLTVITQLERSADISPAPKESSFPSLSPNANTMTCDYTTRTMDIPSYGTPFGTIPRHEPKDLYECSPSSKIPPPPAPSPSASQSSYPPKSGLSSSSDSPTICMHCNRSFSRPSDFK
jgi:hypothetical protein